MKKIAYGLSALLMSLVFAACGDPVNNIKNIASDISENGNDWNETEQWVNIVNEICDNAIAFAESDFNEDELDNFVDACEELVDALNDIDEKRPKRAIEKAMKKIEKDKQLEKRIKAAFKTAKKKCKKLDVDAEDLQYKVMRKIQF